jgi:hypothetical protein
VEVKQHRQQRVDHDLHRRALVHAPPALVEVLQQVALPAVALHQGHLVALLGVLVIKMGRQAGRVVSWKQGAL